MRRNVGCTKLPRMSSDSAASDDDRTRSIAGQWRPLANHFALFIVSVVDWSGVSV